ncbi:MAG: hypothetical protein ACRDNL_04925, partial [Spirillospora sp.]
MFRSTATPEPSAEPEGATAVPAPATAAPATAAPEGVAPATAAPEGAACTGSECSHQRQADDPDPAVRLLHALIADVDDQGPGCDTGLEPAPAGPRPVPP